MDATKSERRRTPPQRASPKNGLAAKFTPTYALIDGRNVSCACVYSAATKKMGSATIWLRSESENLFSSHKLSGSIKNKLADCMNRSGSYASNPTATAMASRNANVPKIIFHKRSSRTRKRKYGTRKTNASPYAPNGGYVKIPREAERKLNHIYL